MKKFIVFLFAICLTVPSFADYESGICMPFKINTDPNNKQYIKSYNADNYLQCGGTQKNNYQCKYSDKIAGGDGYIYECKNDIWEKIQDKSMDTCSLSPDTNAGRHDIVPKDVNAPFIYEVVYYDGGAKIFSYCKYPRNKYEEYKDHTNNNGGVFYGLGARQKPDDSTPKGTIPYGKSNLTCSSTKSNDPSECTLNHVVSSSDGNVYKCTQNGWVTFDDRDINQCVDTIENLEESHGFNGSNTWSIYDKKVEKPEWIYFYESVSGAGCDPAIKIHCKYSTSKYKQEETECETQGGEFLTYGKNDDKDTFYKCYTNNVSPIEITVTDNNNNPLSMVTVIYRDIERTTNSAGKVTLPMVANRKKYNITFKKDGFVDQTVREDVLYSKPTIILNGSSNSSTTFEQPNVTTDPQKNCTNTGGTGLDGNGKCICNDSEHLEEYSYPHTDGKKYSICRCKKGYHREQDADGNYPATNKCVEAYEIKQVPNTEKYRQDAENAYRNEYDNAQSWANKGVTGLSTLMTGEGGKMAAQAWAEQIADRDAETEMTDYLAGMRCEYGNGNTVKLGDETNLPGGNELANYYAEYKTLADKLKTTKAALNLRSGIEAEVLYDRAETGLYQYRVAEIATGDNVSLARALMNPDGDDATKWNAQKTETKQNLWTGVGLAATGVVAGYAANQYVNRNHENEYKNLKMTFTEIKEQIEQEYPEIFTPTQEEVEVRIEQQEPIPTIPTKNKKTTTETSSIPMRVSALAFKSGRIGLSPEGENALREFATEIATQSSEENTKITKLNIVADGYADTDPIRSDSVLRLANEYKQELNTSELPNTYNGKIEENWELADARARKAIYFLKQIFTDKLPSIEINETATGAVDKSCKGTDKTNCRYVNIRIYVTTETTVTEQN